MSQDPLAAAFRAELQALLEKYAKQASGAAQGMALIGALSAESARACALSGVPLDLLKHQIEFAYQLANKERA